MRIRLSTQPHRYLAYRSTSRALSPPLADRLAKATPEQIQTALAYVSVIDPEAFEIAFTAVTAARDEAPED